MELIPWNGVRMYCVYVCVSVIRVLVCACVCVCSINSQCHSKISTTTINNKIYTGVFGSFRLVGDDGDLSAVVSVSEMVNKRQCAHHQTLTV